MTDQSPPTFFGRRNPLDTGRSGTLGSGAGLLLGVAILVGCGLDGLAANDPEPPVATPASSPTSSPATPSPGGEQPATDDPGTGAPAAEASPACGATTAETVGRVAATSLTEASGLAASRQHPGVLWAHNDSGSAAAVHAIGPDGADLGRIAVPAIDGVDIEDMALLDGQIYLADIGDNDARRSSVTVYRFPEPDPAVPVEVTEVESVELRYPDGAIDAEAMFVDPVTGRLVIVAKALGLTLGGDSLVGPAPAPIFEAEPVWGGATMVMDRVGTVALDELADQAEGEIPDGVIADFGLAGLATGADIRADGGAIALRTYRTVWLFPRGQGQSVAEALASAPCPGQTVPESQGEAVAFLPTGDNSFVTVSEGSRPALNVTTVG